MKYIIFDFDGTIGDSQSLIVKTLQDTMRARKLEVKSDEACAKTIGLRLDEGIWLMLCRSVTTSLLRTAVS